MRFGRTARYFESVSFHSYDGDGTICVQSWRRYSQLHVLDFGLCQIGSGLGSITTPIIAQSTFQWLDSYGFVLALFTVVLFVSGCLVLFLPPNNLAYVYCTSWFISHDSNGRSARVLTPGL